MPSIYLGGSRVMSSTLLPAVRAVVVRAARGGHVVTVGCAVGADQAVIQACVSQSIPVRVFAVCAASGAGACSSTALATIQSAASAGVSVQWLAGGSLAVPLVARLMARSTAGLSGAAHALFFAPGVGSLKVASVAISRNIPVSAISPSMPGMPHKCAGQWARAGQVAGVPCWSWASAQERTKNCA